MQSDAQQKQERITNHAKSRVSKTLRVELDTIYTKIAGGQAILGGEEDCHVKLVQEYFSISYMYILEHSKQLYP